MEQTPTRRERRSKEEKGRRKKERMSRRWKRKDIVKKKLVKGGKRMERNGEMVKSE